MEIALENRIAAQNLVKKGRLEVGRQISPLRAKALIELGLAGPAQLQPLPKIIEPTDMAALLVAPTKVAS